MPDMLFFWNGVIPGGHGVGTCADCGGPYAPGRGIAYKLKGIAKPVDFHGKDDDGPVVCAACYNERQADYQAGKPVRHLQFHILGRGKPDAEQLVLTREEITVTVTEVPLLMPGAA